jgi:hypothetical protein
VATSPDGKNWTAIASGTTASLASVVAGDKQFVAVGSGGTILRIVPK